MKMTKIQSTLLFMGFLLVGLTSCGEKSKKEMILGEWKWVSTTELKTQQITKATDNEKIFAIVTQDSLLIREKKARTSNNERYAYQFIQGDSLKLSSNGKYMVTAAIKTLDKNNLELELDIFGPARMKFEK